MVCHQGSTRRLDSGDDQDHVVHETTVPGYAQLFDDFRRAADGPPRVTATSSTRTPRSQPRRPKPGLTVTCTSVPSDARTRTCRACPAGTLRALGCAVRPDTSIRQPVRFGGRDSTVVPARRVDR
jgi:hypothetical protein